MNRPDGNVSSVNNRRRASRYGVGSLGEQAPVFLTEKSLWQAEKEAVIMFLYSKEGRFTLRGLGS